MRIHRFLTLISFLGFATPGPALDRATPPAPAYSYADLADLSLAAPVTAVVRITKAARLKPGETPGIPSGFARFYAEADVETLVRGPQGLPGRVAYLVDVPVDPKGHAAPLKKQRAILLATSIPDRPGELRLVARGAQLVWSEATEATVRAILVAANDADAPPRIIGVAGAFYVPGSLPGESETQIFLTTDDGRPVSLSILRRPAEEPRWVVALGEMVDEAAAPPPPNSLLWYRLACSLPAALPASSTANLDADAATAARADYGLVIEGLGACGRTTG